ncbi:TPA: hypothetical protein DCF80_03405, partial [Candidatus Saccharibacteria bacterium]|nr:hypothetical protein [Candidatus Saccharibacteria bacterium]
MSTDTLSPNTEVTEKDKRRLAFQRSDRVQDHGTAANTYERKDAYEHEMAMKKKRDLADRALHDELATFSPTQLEKEADRLLADADLEEAMINEDNEALPTLAEIEDADEDAEFKQKRLSPSGRNFTVVDVRDEGNYTNED